MRKKERPNSRWLYQVEADLQTFGSMRMETESAEMERTGDENLRLSGQ